MKLFKKIFLILFMFSLIFVSGCGNNDPVEQNPNSNINNKPENTIINSDIFEKEFYKNNLTNYTFNLIESFVEDGEKNKLDVNISFFECYESSMYNCIINYYVDNQLAFEEYDFGYKNANNSVYSFFDKSNRYDNFRDFYNNYIETYIDSFCEIETLFAKLDSIGFDGFDYNENDGMYYLQKEKLNLILDIEDIHYAETLELKLLFDNNIFSKMIICHQENTTEICIKDVGTKTYTEEEFNHFFNEIYKDYFRFELNEDKNSYSLYPKLDIMESLLYVPNEYEGLPVTFAHVRVDIYSSFEENNGSRIIVPEGIKELHLKYFDERSHPRGLDLYYDSILLPNSLEKLEVPQKVGLYDKEFGEYIKENLTFYEGGYYLANRQNPYFALIYVEDKEISNFNINNNTKIISTAVFSGKLPACESDFTNLTSIEIPDSVESISSYAFGYCSSLTNVKLSNNLKYIGVSAFCGISIENINLPKSLEYIDGRAFQFCSNLKAIELSCDNVVIWYDAFDACDNLSIYCKTSPKTNGWDSKWNNGNIPVYWLGEWEYDENGNPKPLNK